MLKLHTPLYNNILYSGNLYNRKVLIIPVDFTDGQPVYENIAKQLADLDIGILGMWCISTIPDLHRKHNFSTISPNWSPFLIVGHYLIFLIIFCYPVECS